MRRAAAGGVAGVLAAGCFSVPPYEPTGGVTYTAAGTGATVAGPGFALRFAGGDGFHFPDALMIGDVDVMGRDPAQGCFREDEIGVLVAPIARISATGPAEPMTSSLVPVLEGPAVVQAAVEWTTRLACDGTHSLGGTSTFTVFPDGRIIRHDTLTDPGTTTLLPSRCACEPPTDSRDMLFNLSTYWTLARDRFENIFLPGESAKDLPTSDGNGNLGGQTRYCVNGDGYQVGFAWDEVTNTRIRSSVASIVLDRLIAIGIPELTTLSEGDRSAIFIERGGCTEALARAQAHADAPEIMINGDGVMPAERDGIYGGGGAVLVPAGDRAVLVGPTSGSFAVWLRFSRSADAVRATRDGAKGAWYIPQRVGDREWIVWFPDALAMDQTITIEPH